MTIDPQDSRPSPAMTGHHGGHHWMMIACCIPMILIAVALVATGVASPGFLVVALLCVGMMSAMMWGMGADEHQGHSSHTSHEHQR